MNNENNYNVNRENVISNNVLNNNPNMSVNTNETVNLNQNINSNIASSENSFKTSEIDNINDEVLIEAFIGEKYNKMTESGFSVPAIFLTSTYYFYRKMYLLGFLIAVIKLIIFFLPLKYLHLGFNVFLGVFTNKIYFKFINYKINKIKIKNKGKSQEQLVNICAFQGRTSIGAAISLTILQVIITIITIIIFIFGGLSFSLFSNTYKGVLTYRDIDVTEKFNVTIPKEFIKDSQRSIYYSYETKPSEVFSKCEFHFGAVDKFSDSKALIESMAKYSKASNTVSSSMINDINWDTFAENNPFGQTYYYALKKDGVVYLANYQIGKEADKNVCRQYQNAIINSISNK